MARQLPHTKLLDAAAKDALAPLGLRRKGRSRVWLDDRAWWLGIVDFQPSDGRRGTYLNVGVHWLWHGIGLPPPAAADAPAVSWTFAFEPLGRVMDLPGGRQFVEYESDEQFEPVAQATARIAAERVQQQRERLRTPADAAEELLPPHRDISGGRDSAIALAIAGRSREALASLDKAEERTRARIGTERESALDSADLERDRHLRELISTGEIATAASETVMLFRRATGLPDDVRLPF